LLHQAEQADQRDEDPQRLPAAMARREALRKKMAAACARLEARAKARAEAEKLRTPEGRALYRRRACTVEPIFGVIKAVLGFGQFLLLGLQKVLGKWTLVCPAYNLKRLRRLGAGLVWPRRAEQAGGTGRWGLCPPSAAVRQALLPC